MKKLAFNNVNGTIFELTDENVQQGIEASRKSPRKRIILPIHRVQEADVQRMINFLQPGTYIRPHKHPLPQATESIVMLRGSIRFFTFDDFGNRLTSRIIGSNPFPGVIDIEPDIWHSFIVLEPDTIIFECKKGPYNSKMDKHFAEWSPVEGSDQADEWMRLMEVEKGR
jgi:cupin fold WbuC family metalloprotein